MENIDLENLDNESLVDLLSALELLNDELNVKELEVGESHE